ncbi:IncF plasmid conjugative transfer pilus assembly protein TraC [Streptococcus dysgalactiae subsp. equisimilis AC-2713]|uniref:IncF plasmid conjugative transfer pilus assembly protein TraC n=1 Tax=Streptococcus dysgalactiae subsp. equisimilis AC-2713 TaxID=759913 RepID=A0AB33R8D0_STREQ|nr:hypothetical protein HMPREF9963_1743 [Streptococcus dysgalactiae subsp. equisimilis SK1250]CCI62942.1 IncF plasmid conjugative transfer pilus assembly protein TraC [Streptococcus dysgalactiae subsp. equisimilis AC-2713]
MEGVEQDVLNSFYFLRREVSNDDEMTSSKFLKKDSYHV